MSHIGHLQTVDTGKPGASHLVQEARSLRMRDRPRGSSILRTKDLKKSPVNYSCKSKLKAWDTWNLISLVGNNRTVYYSGGSSLHKLPLSFDFFIPFGPSLLDDITHIQGRSPHLICWPTCQSSPETDTRRRMCYQFCRHSSIWSIWQPKLTIT
jgi:hypothetical protein